MERREWWGRTGYEMGATLGGCDACALSMKERWLNLHNQQMLKQMAWWVTSPPRAAADGDSTAQRVLPTPSLLLGSCWRAAYAHALCDASCWPAGSGGHPRRRSSRPVKAR